jgi:quercetin dioxygenase-like cupin family protein
MEFYELESQPVQTDITMCPGLFVKHAVFDAGSYIPQHAHEHAHLSVVASGSVRAWKDGVLLGDYRAPAGIVIEARAKHTFLALADGTAILCVHRVDEDGEPAIHEEHHLTFVDKEVI